MQSESRKARPSVTVQYRLSGQRYLRADRKIRIGEIVACEDPLFFSALSTIPPAPTNCVLPPTEQAVYHLAYAVMQAGVNFSQVYLATFGQEHFDPNEARKLWPSLNAADLERLKHCYCIVSTNNFQTRLNNSTYGFGLYPTLSYINHRCLDPNCVPEYSINGTTLKIVAVRHIDKGEEITIPYAEFGDNAPRYLRQAYLLQSFGFTCTCETCADDTECAYCGESGGKPLMLCGQCQKVAYCSRKCQKFDWRHGTHRTTCQSGQ